MSSTQSPVSGTAPEHHHDDHSRNLILDILRGVAILGILLISIREFGGFTNNEQNFFGLNPHGGNYKLFYIISVLFEGKMTALMAMVFGAGLVVFMQKKEYPAPLAAPDAWIRHQFWLIAFGIFNAFVLLWPADILFRFGVLGILLFAFWRMRSKGLLIAAIICTLIYCGKQYWYFADDKDDHKKYTVVMELEKKFKQDSTDQAKKDSLNIEKYTVAQIKLNDSLAKKNDTLNRKQEREKGKWEGTIKGLKYDSSALAAENKAMRTNSYCKTWSHLVERSKNKESFWLYSIGTWEMAAPMFLGMFLLGIGFFSRRFSPSKYIITAIITLGIGFALAWVRMHYSSIKLFDYAGYVGNQAFPPNQFFPIENILLATGYASLLLLLLRAKMLNWLWQSLAAAGRLALTNYIIQTIICTFFFYGYGFGYFGRLTQLQLYFMVAEIWMVQIVFSVLWLRYYTMGPLEWLWRCMVYRKWLPWKIKRTNTDSPAT